MGLIFGAEGRSILWGQSTTEPEGAGLIIDQSRDSEIDRGFRALGVVQQPRTPRRHPGRPQEGPSHLWVQLYPVGSWSLTVKLLRRTQLKCV